LRLLADNDLYRTPSTPSRTGRSRDVVKDRLRARLALGGANALHDDVADVLADGSRRVSSIQSAPLGFKPRVTGADVVASYTQHVLRVAAHLVALEARTGRTVTLALEPEPFCFLETTDETVAYFTNHLYTGASAAALAKLAGIPISEAHVALRRHVGVVFDICHQAVVFEDISQSLQKLVDAGIPIFKLQEAAAPFPRSPKTPWRC
jgi:sugar phosphate isomerase/epimerase